MTAVLSMAMAMVSITHMRVCMLQLVVPMLMGMPEGLIGRDTFQVVGLMAVLVMGIAAAWIVPVAMGMTQRLMAAGVLLLLREQHSHWHRHQASGHQQLG